MTLKEITIEPKMFVDILAVLGFLIVCFLYMEHYNEIQNEVNAILTRSLEDLNSNLANTSASGK
ncbi:hypothetical protein [Maribacter antarcticus]|uniref:hypothetical protein n=1 Tax=Maribacter antarcticus TaxID=505250 RepID=UPI00047D70C5|nr:hypothetical protein [Maribacter antarcticus]